MLLLADQLMILNVCFAMGTDVETIVTIRSANHLKVRIIQQSQITIQKLILNLNYFKTSRNEISSTDVIPLFSTGVKEFSARLLRRARPADQCKSMGCVGMM
ncbi:hypothetical protein A0E43_09035 [Pectobacterium cacticida]